MSELWPLILKEIAETQDPLARQLGDPLLSAQGLADAVQERLTQTLADGEVSQDFLHELIRGVDSSWTEPLERDLRAYFDRDFAIQSYLEVLLLSHGFMAVTAHRLAHALWQAGQRMSAQWINQRVAALWGIDLHPAARIGVGLVIDHGMGTVVGETAVIGDYVFLFHNVTLGGTGRAGGDRHPKVGDRVVIGTGATLLGNIHIGEEAVVAANSVVLKDVPPRTTVAGIPAKEKGQANPLQ
ncbi:MAG: serine O-acetyltransferase [Bacteroidota bacterium]